MLLFQEVYAGIVHLDSRMKNALHLMIALAVLSGCAAPPQTVQIARADTWQRSKECAEQPARLMAEWHTPADDIASKSGIPPSWENHYSARYGRCFLVYSHEVVRSGGTGTLFEKLLYDPFERTTLAETLDPVPPASMEFLCNTPDEPHSGCRASREFIEQHMKQ